MASREPLGRTGGEPRRRAQTSLHRDRVAVQSCVHASFRTGSGGEPMSIELNHTIVHVKDRWAASREVGQVLGLPEATAYGPFAELKLENGASLDFMDTEGKVHAQHYAFLVSEDDFDDIFGRLQAEGRKWWADPYKRQPQEINHGDGGRGLYWDGPDGHWLEIITRPYGSGG